MNISTLYSKPHPRNEPVICNGNDLDSVCSDLRARQCVPWRLDTCVGGHNAAYEVHYFRCVGEQQPPTTGLTKTRPPAAPTNLTVPVLDEPCKTPTFDSGPKCSEVQASNEKPHPEMGRTPEAVKTISLESRLATLQQKLRERGKLGRGKLTTHHEHTRTPYKDD